jgi:hypothetical protein
MGRVRRTHIIRVESMRTTQTHSNRVEEPERDAKSGVWGRHFPVLVGLQPCSLALCRSRFAMLAGRRRFIQ